MFRFTGSSLCASQQAIKTLARRGAVLRSQLRSQRGLSTSPDPSSLSETMSANPWKTLFAGTTLGYFVAMYLERTTYKDEFVRDSRHKPKMTTPGAVTGLPTAK